MNKKTSFISLFLLGSLLFIYWYTSKQGRLKTETASWETFKPIGKSDGVKTEYDLSLKMKKENTFDVRAVIDITNTSKDKINLIELYFIPNMFTEKYLPTLTHPSKINVHTVQINRINSNYTLNEDNLNIPLLNPLTTNKKISLTISYTFSLPDKGFRFTKRGNNMYLGEWYPMVPTYREGKGWNKNKYLYEGETYHTSFSNFKLRYNIPSDFTVVTTSDKDHFPSKNNDYLEINNVKEIFISVLKNPNLIRKKVGNVEIRLINFEESSQKSAMDIAARSLEYFSSIIGPYPFKQLDILSSNAGMEYPGIVTVDTMRGRSDFINRMIVHEIAHQWFYGVISNDPFNDAWLDEGITSLVTNLFLADKKEIPNYIPPVKLKPMPSNLPLIKYNEGESSNYIYGQSSLELLKIFNHYGGRKTMEKFLKEYYYYYHYKEIDTKEFIRFLKYQLDIKDDKLFERWLLLK